MKKTVARLCVVIAVAAGAIVVGAAPGLADQSPFVADLSGDGIADRITLQNAVGTTCPVLVEQGLAGGGFAAPKPQSYLLPDLPRDGNYCPDLGVVVDLAGDGSKDLVLTWFPGSPYRSGQETLTVRGWTNVALWPGIWQVSAIWTGDFNGDGRTDVIEGTDQGEGVRTYLNQPDGSLVEGPARICTREGFPPVRLADFDQDGATDLVSVNADDCGDAGVYGPAVTVVDGPTGSATTLMRLSGDRSNIFAWGAFPVDLDADGDLDVDVRTRASEPPLLRHRFLNDGTGRFAEMPVVEEHFTSSRGSMTTVKGGTWAVSNGRYALTNPAVASSAGNSNLSVSGAYVDGDFTLTTSAMVKATADAWDNFSVVFAYQDAANYDYASFNESNNLSTSGLFRVRGGVLTQLADITKKITAGTTYKVTIERRDDEVRVYLGGIEVTAASDPLLGVGQVGYGTRNKAATFDDLRVLAGAPTIVLYESFTATVGGMQAISGGTWGAINGAYTVASPALITGPGVSNLSVHTNRVGGDFTLTTTATARSTASTTDNFAIVYDFLGPTHYSYVSFSESNTTHLGGAFQVRNGVVTQLRDFPATITPGTNYQIRLERRGGTMSFYRGSALVGIVPFTDGGWGQVGYGTRNKTAIFDNLKVVAAN
jgi:hypothetical protein